MEITELLGMAVDAGASDLHLKAGNYPMLRIQGVTDLAEGEMERVGPSASDSVITRFGD